LIDFNGQKAYQYAREISKPRLVGSEGEKAVRDYIIEKLKSFGYQVKEEVFEFSPSLYLYFKGYLLVIIGLLTISLLSQERYPLLATSASAIVLLFILSSSPLLRRAFALACGLKFWRKKLKSSNIIARLNPKGSTPPIGFYFIAHYDSKSQNFSLPKRILLIGTLLLGAFFLSIWAIISSTGINPSKVWGVLFYGLSVLSGGLLLFLKTENRSPGALDNASGVGILLHLAEILSPGDNFDITFLFTGAEEMGLVGAFAYCKTHKKELLRAKEKRFFINLDSPGIDGRIYVACKDNLLTKLGLKNKHLLKRIGEAAKREGLRVHTPLVIFGASADHLPFAMLGLQVLTISTFSRKAFAIHTSRDTVELLDPKVMGKIGRLLCRFIG